MTVETMVAACKRLLPQLEWVGDAATLPYDAAEGFERTGSGLRAVVVVCHEPHSDLTFAELRVGGRRIVTYMPREIPRLLGYPSPRETASRAAA